METTKLLILSTFLFYNSVSFSQRKECNFYINKLSRFSTVSECLENVGYIDSCGGKLMTTQYEDSLLRDYVIMFNETDTAISSYCINREKTFPIEGNPNYFYLKIDQSERTFYLNNKIRSSMTQTSKKYEYRAFSKKRKLLFEEKIVNEDTLSGLFAISYLKGENAGIRFSFYEKGKLTYHVDTDLLYDVLVVNRCNSKRRIPKKRNSVFFQSILNFKYKGV